MTESQSFREIFDTGAAAIKGITSDGGLTVTEQRKLIDLDPSVESTRQTIADIFAVEEAQARAMGTSQEGGSNA